MPLGRFRCRGLIDLDEPTRLLGEYRFLLACPSPAVQDVPSQHKGGVDSNRFLNWASRFEFGKPARFVSDIGRKSFARLVVYSRMRLLSRENA